MRSWFRNVVLAITTIAEGMYVTLWYFLQTYKRRTFTSQFEYPERPVPVKPRYRGFHRFDLPTGPDADPDRVIHPARPRLGVHRSRSHARDGRLPAVIHRGGRRLHPGQPVGRQADPAGQDERREGDHLRVRRADHWQRLGAVRL